MQEIRDDVWRITITLRDWGPSDHLNGTASVSIDEILIANHKEILQAGDYLSRYGHQLQLLRNEQRGINDLGILAELDWMETILALVNLVLVGWRRVSVKRR